MIEMALIVAVITAVGEGLKKAGVPANYMPIASVGLGLVAGYFFIGGAIEERLFYGVAVGLAASGFFDLSKLPILNKENNK
ncbi:hypothetical protein [Halobacillus ihumii]|uniref:hypothetical protein n=1 Tax=Halobacillus ihumii TaxID=2686092 RepID=UPI0013D2C5F3|nr:hypothetical protein [Halobacillus ihumii]